MANQAKRLGIIVGSLRTGSNSKAIANGILELLPEGVAGALVEIGGLPLYNQDFDDPALTPQSYVEFREQVSGLDGLIFVTPEYNRSVPAVLKNALDIGSRPASQANTGLPEL